MNKPCPFCGEAHDIDLGQGTPDREGTPSWLYCGTCGAQGPWCYSSRAPEIDAAKEWNTRATPPEERKP